MGRARKQILVIGIVVQASIDGYAAACSITDIAITQAEIIIQNRMTYVVGEVANACQDDARAFLHVSLKDDDGTVVLDGTFSPTGDRDIPAHGRRRFSFVVSPIEMRPERHASHIEVEVVGLRGR